MSDINHTNQPDHQASAAGRKPVVDVVRTPEETMRANLEAPGHAVGYAIKTGSVHPREAGGFECMVDGVGRIWRTEDRDDGMWLVLAGWLNT